VSKLHLCASQTENKIPYTFEMTGIRVFTLEEALYHCLHHWRQSMEDVFGAPFLGWLREIGLYYHAEQISGFSAIENSSMAYLSFLSMTDFLPRQAIAALQKELAVWGQRHVWEKYKEQGDFWLAQKNGERAFVFYEKALKNEQNAPLFNNAALALLLSGEAKRAADFFGMAADLEIHNQQLRFNHIEALISAGLFDEAKYHLEKMEQSDPEVLYFLGHISYAQKNYFEGIRLFGQASQMTYDPDYIYALSDCYMKTRQFSKAIDILGSIRESDQNLEFFQKLASHQAEGGNVPAAIKTTEKALLQERANPQLWIDLAGYYRKDYNHVRAAGAVLRALALSPQSPEGILEQARIKKAEGRTKEYQSNLGQILDMFKEKYRKDNM